MGGEERGVGGGGQDGAVGGAHVGVRDPGPVRTGPRHSVQENLRRRANDDLLIQQAVGMVGGAKTS